MQLRDTGLPVPDLRPNSTAAWQYLVITPVRNEEAYLKFTIESMLVQTVRPAQWVIVNDGSTDSTAQIIDEYARQHPWIQAVHRADRGFRKAGGGVVEAFNDGLRSASCQDWEFIVKLDGDLTLEPDYFEKCLEQFRNDSRLGVGGGVICNVIDGVKTVEKCPAFHVRGATKIYRRECWEAIGGFWPAPGWDTMDEVKASMLGWTSRSFPGLHLLHHRLTGTAEGLWAGIVKNGRANYICGYHPLFMISKCLGRLIRKPYLVGSVALFYGFASGYLKRIPRVADTETIQYLRDQQMKRLLGKETIWK
jgi:biofilm PGA synthesis N-glycosyltransferase PgaC